MSPFFFFFFFFFFCLFLLPSGHAIIRPGGASGGVTFGSGSCSEEHAHKHKHHHHHHHPAPSSNSQSSEEASSPVDPSCPSGWTMYDRTPSDANQNTGKWCVKLITSKTMISVNEGSELCSKENAVLTSYENDAERQSLLSEANEFIISTLGKSAGSIAMAGRRVQSCLTTASLSSAPCNSKSTIFAVPDSADTDATYLWTTWATKYNEPNSVENNGQLEDCVTFQIDPSESNQHGQINDFLCQYAYSFRWPTMDLYQNFGALCGKAPQ
ncbi:unnamed protein product [Caenorhabditis sp. 36 PRJEB53466]|nr:unnamed protein product [Caenorhabditis sp. 36 PRJEB53466]